MSQREQTFLDRASPQNQDRGPAWPATSFDRLTTEGVPGGQRLDYWRNSVLRRMDPTALNETPAFAARYLRLSGSGVELVEHASNFIAAQRNDRRSRDYWDDIAIGLMVSCDKANLDHEGEHRLHAGDMYVVDYARPVRVRWSRATNVSVIIPRDTLRDMVGDDVPRLGGFRLPKRGMAALLASHMRQTIKEAASLSTPDQAAALRIVVEMVSAVLQTHIKGRAEMEQGPAGFYHAALALIARDCGDPELTPLRVAAELGCSRASLYRVFAAERQSVASTIWTTRLDAAFAMLGDRSHARSSISQIAWSTGFVDQSTFSRMFKRRFAMTASEARHV